MGGGGGEFRGLTVGKGEGGSQVLEVGGKGRVTLTRRLCLYCCVRKCPPFFFFLLIGQFQYPRGNVAVRVRWTSVNTI